MPTLGKTIRRLRKAKGLTQRELASQVGINFTYLSKIENDRLERGQSPKEETLELFARALDTNVESLCLLAGKVPQSIARRVLKHPDVFGGSTWLDAEAFRRLLRGLDEEEKRGVEEALGRANNFLQGVLDSLATHIAVLDAVGTIVAVNKAWSNFALENGLTNEMSGPGANYLGVCDAATGRSSEGAKDVSENIRAILAGKRTSYELEYPCHSPNKERWFLLRVSRFEHYGDTRLVVAHDDVTSRKLAELAARV